MRTARNKVMVQIQVKENVIKKIVWGGVQTVALIFDILTLPSSGANGSQTWFSAVAPVAKSNISFVEMMSISCINISFKLIIH